MSYPLTLPTRYIDGYNNGYKFVCVVKLTLSGIQPIYFCTQPNVFGTLTIQYLGRELVYGTELFYDDKLAASVINGAGETEYDGIGEIDYSVDLQSGGGLASRNLASLTFLNKGTFYDFLSQFDIENGEVEIWESFLPTSGTFNITSDMLLRFKGVLSGAPTYTYETLRVEAIDSRHLDDVYLPKQTITKISFPYRPSENDGALIPIVAGDFYGGTDIANGRLNLAPAVMVNNIVPCFAVADSQMHTSGSVFFNDINGLAGTLVGVTDIRTGTVLPGLIYGPNGAASPTNPSTGLPYSPTASYVRFGGGAPYADFIVYPSLLGSNDNYSGAQVLDYESAVDKDEKTSIAVPNGGGLILRMPAVTAPGTYINADDIRCLTEGGFYRDFAVTVVLSNVVGNIRLGTRTVNETTPNSFNYSTSLSNGTNTKYWTYPTGTFTGWGDVLNVEIVIDATYAGTNSCNVIAAYLTIRSTVDDIDSIFRLRLDSNDASSYRAFGSYRHMVAPPVLPKSRPTSKIFVQLKGVKYGDWISGRSSYNTSDFIENPAYFIEWLLREKMGVSGSRINTGTFDSAATARDEWKLAVSIADSKKADKYIRQICFEFGLVLYLFPDSTTGEDQYTLKPLPTAGDAVAYTVTTGDIISDPESHVPQITIAQTGGEKIVNDFYCRYKKNYATDDYEESVYYSDVNQEGTIRTNISARTGQGLIVSLGTLVAAGSSSPGENVNFIADGIGPGAIITCGGQERTVDYVENYETLYTTSPFSPGISSPTAFTFLPSSQTPLRWGDYSLWLSESQSRYRTINPTKLTFDFIRDESTAIRTMLTYADWWAFKRQIVTVQVKKTLDTVKRQIGDIVKFDVDLVGSDRKNIILYVITKVNFPPYGKTSAPYITWECEEVPNEVTGLPIYKKLASKYTVIE